MGSIIFRDACAEFTFVKYGYYERNAKRQYVLLFEVKNTSGRDIMPLVYRLKTDDIALGEDFMMVVADAADFLGDIKVGETKKSMANVNNFTNAELNLDAVKEFEIQVGYCLKDEDGTYHYGSEEVHSDPIKLYL